MRMHRGSHYLSASSIIGSWPSPLGGSGPPATLVLQFHDGTDRPLEYEHLTERGAWYRRLLGEPPPMGVPKACSLRLFATTLRICSGVDHTGGSIGLSPSRIRWLLKASSCSVAESALRDRPPLLEARVLLLAFERDAAE